MAKQVTDKRKHGGRASRNEVMRITAHERLDQLDADDPLFAAAAHEAGHAVYYQGQIRLPISGAWDHFENHWGHMLDKHGVTKLDRLAVSEYAGTKGKHELFSEVSSMIAQKRSKELPKNVLTAYREAMKDWEPKDFNHAAKHTVH